MTKKSQQPEGSREILIVDDSHHHLLAFRRIIRNLGYLPICVQDSDEALRILKKKLPALMIIDVVLENSDGRKLAKQIRKDHPKLPIVLISGYDDVAMQKHEFPFLQKPILPESIRDVIYRLLGNGK